MSKGKRYEEPKLNLKKVFAVIIAFVVIIMFIFIIKGILDKDEQQVKITSKDYFVVFKDNKYGVIDSDAQTVIDPSYEEMIVIPNSKNDVFLCVYDIDYDKEEYKTKALNSKNEEIFTEYEQVEAIQNKDESGNLWYEDNVLKVKKDGKYGIINLSGKEIVACEYDDITVVDGIKNALKIQKNGQYGVIDNEGKLIVETKYKDILKFGKDNKSGFIVQNEEGKYGIVDYSNQIILETKYANIKRISGNEMYVVEEDGKQQLIKKDGTQVLTEGFTEIKSIMKNADNGIIFSKDGKVGVMKTSGEMIIEPIYEDLKEAKTGILIAKKDGKYGVIDTNKETKVEFKYNSITYNEKADIYIAENEEFNNDIINNAFEVKQSGILVDFSDEKGYFELRQGNDYKYYNFKFEEKKVSEIHTNNTLFLSKKDNKYGFVDKDGNVVVDYIYDDATEQNTYGYAAIKKDGKWGSVDKKGNVVQEPVYNLEDYLKIDFVGRWHYGKDVNMNYYNQL